MTLRTFRALCGPLGLWMIASTPYKTLVEAFGIAFANYGMGPIMTRVASLPHRILMQAISP